MLVKNVAPNDVVMVFVTTLLLIPGIITPSEALAGAPTRPTRAHPNALTWALRVSSHRSGFSSVGILTIAVLFVVAAGIAETGSIGLLSGTDGPFTSPDSGRTPSLRRLFVRLFVCLLGAQSGCWARQPAFSWRSCGSCCRSPSCRPSPTTLR
jgi:hypothetical protein